MTSKDYYEAKLRALPEPEARLATRAPLPTTQIRQVHLVAVCGTAMGSLAGLFVQAGYKVTGSDTGCYEPMKSLIAELGITFYEGFDAKNLEGADVVIVGNANGPQNVEAVSARENNIPILSLPEAIAHFFIGDKRSLVVAGTHGKTTTTGLIAHILEQGGYNPSYLIGGVPQQSKYGFHVGTGNFFVIEGDEYDSAYFDKRPKFLHYKPTSAIITSIEFDHIDIYTDMDDYRQAFRYFAELIPEDGTLMICGDLEEPNAFSTHPRAITYGLQESNAVTMQHRKVENGYQTGAVIYKGDIVGTLATPLSGTHNLSNVLAVTGLLMAEGIPFETIAQGVHSYTGMKRRQEVIFDKDITVIDDFAHHPTAVRETLKGLKEKYSSRRIVAVFEPRSNTSRRKIFEQPYAESFDDADIVFLKTPPLRHNDTKEDFIDAQALTQAISTRVEHAEHYENIDELLPSLLKQITSRDVVVIMSNGSFDGLHEKLINALA